MRAEAVRDMATLPGLPHLLTASRVVMGAVALNAALDGQFTRAALFITAAAVVDGLDGKLARWLNASSPFGGVFDYFCAYNTGVGWRQIIEKMHMTATLTKWYDEHGRHKIYAGGRGVELSDTSHSLILDAGAVAAGSQKDLDDLGVAKNAREEKLRARKIEIDGAKSAEDERMAALYRQQVLREQAPEPVIKIAGLGGTKKPARI